KYEVLALTSRSFDTHCSTFSQLKSINIDFSNFSLCSKTLYFEGEYYAIFKNGIFFTNGNNKGEMLEKFLDKINFCPKAILYVDDKFHHLQRVEKICQKKNIPFIGLRYGFLDEAIKNFDSSIAEMQFKNFGKILSDEDAKKLSK
ncbi:MAG: DUF2608 domain-containing protein, partial [Chlamydiae bacterium]|nr:DUF2608 domain-containing protein [Chlamydiota bacterium]